MKKGKKAAALLMMLAMTAVSFHTQVSDAWGYVIDEHVPGMVGKSIVSELPDQAVGILDELAVTEKEMLDDAIERTYLGDFKSKIYILKIKGDKGDTGSSTYYSQYLKSRGDCAIRLWEIKRYTDCVAYENGYNYVAVKLTLKPWWSPFNQETWTMDRWDEYNDKITQVEKEIGILDESLCDYQKIQLAYIWIKQNVEYGYASEKYGYSITGGQDSIEAVLDGYAVCAGYSRIFNRFMHDAGIDCYWVSNTTTTNHAFNLVRLENVYYKVDCQASSLDCYPGYEQYNQNGKTLWLMTGIFSTIGSNSFKKNYNEASAIYYYNPDLSLVSKSEGDATSVLTDAQKVVFAPLAEITLPTCTKDGTFLKESRVDEHCDYCGKVHSFTMPASHHYETVGHRYPTCIREGYIKKRCSECGSETEEVIPKTAHHYRMGVREATCRDEGEFLIFCDTCGEELYVYHCEQLSHQWTDWKEWPKKYYGISGWEFRDCDAYVPSIYGQCEVREWRNIYTGEITEKEPLADAKNPEEATTESESTTPNPTVPEVTTPDVTVPEVTTPETTTPEETTPNVTTQTVPPASEEVTTTGEPETEKVQIPKETEKITGNTTTVSKQPERESVKTVKKPGKVKVSAKNLKGRKIKVTWKKIKAAKKYQVKYVLGKKTVLKNVKKTRTSYTIKKLKQKKVYKIYVRALGEAGWGKWSKVKKVRVKK